MDYLGRHRSAPGSGHCLRDIIRQTALQCPRFGTVPRGLQTLLHVKERHACKSTPRRFSDSGCARFSGGPPWKVLRFFSDFVCALLPSPLQPRTPNRELFSRSKARKSIRNNRYLICVKSDASDFRIQGDFSRKWISTCATIWRGLMVKTVDGFPGRARRACLSEAWSNSTINLDRDS